MVYTDDLLPHTTGVFPDLFYVVLLVAFPRKSLRDGD